MEAHFKELYQRDLNGMKAKLMKQRDLQVK
jgi:hypothetical protein